MIIKPKHDFHKYFWSEIEEMNKKEMKDPKGWIVVGMAWMDAKMSLMKI